MSKIAVPARSGLVDPHFGHCEYFAVFEVEGNKIVGEKRVDAPAECGCKTDIASVLAADGVGTMVAGNMGEGAVRVLKASGIEVVRGASGPAREAAEAWLAGKLADSGVGCAGHGDDCH
jgi:predicted Fe-Mo cluster-binding NifX family protein